MKNLLAATTILLFAVPAFAQDDHEDEHGHSDIEFSYVDGAIRVEFGDEGAVFEGAFPTEGIDRLFTSEPGFASELEEGMGIGAGDQIVYNVLADLAFWNRGFQAVPGGAQIRIVNKPPSPVVPDTIVPATHGVQRGSFAPSLNRIGEAEADGDFHSDLQFFLEPNIVPDPLDESLFGAYGIKLSLATDAEGIDESDPFFIVFNYGLEQATFEEGVEAFASIVPEPGSFSLVGIGVAALGWLVRTRKR